MELRQCRTFAGGQYTTECKSLVIKPLCGRGRIDLREIRCHLPVSVPYALHARAHARAHTIISVSYTHLDVYKRQDLSNNILWSDLWKHICKYTCNQSICKHRKYDFNQKFSAVSNLSRGVWSTCSILFQMENA